MKIRALRRKRIWWWPFKKRAVEFSVEVPTNSTKEAVIAFNKDHPNADIVSVNEMQIETICDGCGRPIFQYQSYATAMDEHVGPMSLCDECVAPWIHEDNDEQ